MANELKVNGYTTASTVYAIVENMAGQIWRVDSTAFEAYTAGDITHYAISLTEVAATTGRYRGAFPTAILTAGRYNISFYKQVGGSPAVTDTYISSDYIEWTGSYVISQASDLNSQIAKFSFTGSNVNSAPQTLPAFPTHFGSMQINSSGLIQLDLTQAIPTSNTAQTTGDAFNAARAQGFGKWVLNGTTLTLYAPDGATAVRTFTLNSATAPTSRT
jgi:hypothetical protein